MAATTISNRSRSPYLHDRGQDFPWMTSSHPEKVVDAQTGAITQMTVGRPIDVTRTRLSDVTSSYDKNWMSSCLNVESDSSSGSSSCSSTTRGRRRFRKRVTQYRPPQLPRRNTVIVLGVYEVLIHSETMESSSRDDCSISSVSCDER
jgi:hypothetical protein